LSTDQWDVRKQSIAKYDTTSNLILLPAHLERLRNSAINVLVSSKSGAGLAESAFDNLLEPLFQEFEITFSIHKTSSKTSHKEFVKDIIFSSSKENIIVIFGGDTLVFDVLNSLPKNPHIAEGPQITLCPIPCGTGNALATSLGITTIPIGISRTLGLAKPVSSLVRLPTLRIAIHESGREQVIYAAVVCSWGLHASLVADSDDPEMRRQYGPQRFQV
jgi:diacylglycerol kinase family enzyme